MTKQRRKAGSPLWVNIIRWASLLLAIGLIFANPWQSGSHFPPELYFLFDPLLSLSVIIGQWILLPVFRFGLITIICTVLLGRVFCGYICPLGVWLDVSNARHGVKERKALPLRLRYIILFTLLFLAIFGFPLVFLFDPQGIFYRALTLAVVPFGGKALALGAYSLEKWGFLSSSAEGITGWLQGLAQSPDGIRFYLLGFVAVLMFGTITILERLAPRFWCRYLCPLGGLLSLFSRFAFMRRLVDKEKCTSCLACQKSCPMGAIGDQGHSTDMSLCFNCKECKSHCPTDAISFRWKRPKPSEASAIDVSRRAALGSLGLAVLGAASVKLNLLSFNRVDLIRPPGALPEDKFLGRCIGCMRCAEVCPTNIIVPTDLRRGMTSLYTPRLDFTRQGCSAECAACGYVCPTEAIIKSTLEEKMFFKIGTAVVDRGRCLAWAQSQMCMVCKESCPYGAIAAKNQNAMFGETLVPAVDRARCVGCGTCEANCPVNSKPAIVVISDGEDRGSGTFPPNEKVIKIRQRRRSKHIEDDTPPGISVE